MQDLDRPPRPVCTNMRHDNISHRRAHTFRTHNFPGLFATNYVAYVLTISLYYYFLYAGSGDYFDLNYFPFALAPIFGALLMWQMILLTRMRVFIREKFKINGNFCCDAITMIACTPCALSQVVTDYRLHACMYVCICVCACMYACVCVCPHWLVAAL